MAASEEEYLAALDATIDVILADYMLPKFSALDALDRLHDRGLEIPLIVVTGALGDEAAVECIKRGAADHLIKDRLARLGSAVSRAVQERRTADELRLSRETAAEALRLANITLEQRVAERTRALTEANEQLRHAIGERRKTEDQLRQAQKMEAIGQLTGGIAHDFNNLLTSIIGNVELALGRDGNGSAARRLHGALRSAHRGVQLTSQLLAIGRRQTLRAHAVDLNALILGLQDMLASTMTPAIRIRLSLSAQLWPAFADPTQIELALLNLAINARDAMSSSGTLCIETRNLPVGDPDRPDDLGSAGVEYVALTVSDSGMGMTQEVRARAFEPFFTTKESGKGSGLGLSMVYGLAKQHGGTVRIDSAPGRGASMTIYLPRAAATSDQPVPVVQGALGETSAAVGNVLLVDDDPAVLEVTAKSLRQVGYVVTDVGSAASALAIMDRGEEVDILVTDLVMPDMAGSTLADAARLRRPDLPVMLITGHAGDMVTAGATGQRYPVLQKPFSLAEFATMVAECRRSHAGLR